MERCKKCDAELTYGDKFILKSDKCLSCHLDLKKRPRPVERPMALLHYTKKMYRGGRL